MGDVSGYDADDGWFLIRSLRNLPCRLAACTPRDEKGRTETHFCIKDLLLSSPTSLIGDPVSFVFFHKPGPVPEKQDWIPDYKRRE